MALQEISQAIIYFWNLKFLPVCKNKKHREGEGDREGEGVPVPFPV